MDPRTSLHHYPGPMRPPLHVRPARPDDADAMADVHVESWRQTYRGLMRDEVLDDPGLLPARGRFWNAVLTEERYEPFRAAVAESDGAVVGIALAGPPTEPEIEWDTQLYVLYLLDAFQGNGAGRGLMEAVLPASASAGLWVADPNPRAQVFYAKRGFIPDGGAKLDDGVSEIRMVRAAHHVMPPSRTV